VTEATPVPEPEDVPAEEQPVRRRPGLPPIMQYTTKGLHPTRLPVSITDISAETGASEPATTTEAENTDDDPA
jgi:hypothetical protein